MKNVRLVLFVFIALFLTTSPSYSQSKETGALKGAITLEDGSNIPGVLVTIDSDDIVAAKKTTITNEQGKYRFVGLLPGTYNISASLEGFAKAKQTGIKIHTSKTITVDLVLTQGKITEEIVVLGKSALVDVKDSSTASIEMPSEYLQNIPNNQFSTNAVNLAPGVTNDVAYGAAMGTGIAYQIDGVDVSDPAGGTAWVFLDYNVIEEISVVGVGAPAEYGGFTGVVFNTVTKSGGNTLKGYSEFLYQGKSWNSKNSDNPDFEPGKEMVYSGHFDIGGPLIENKLSYFASILVHRSSEQLADTDYDLDYKQPKGFLKLSYQPTTKTRLQFFVEYDSYNGSGRDGNASTEEAATVDQISPEAFGNISIHHLFSNYTFMEAKIAFFSGYYSLEPHSGLDLSGHTDFFTGENTVNALTVYRGDRLRLQANASISHHADDFMGTHDFKFGAEFIHMDQQDQFGYTDGKYYADWQGEPYALYENVGYDINASLNTISVYAQDSWSVNDRLTINPGVRIDFSRGSVDDLPGTQFKPKPGIAPRIGFTYDVFGDHSTAVKAHWGRYYEGSYIYTFTPLSTSRSDYKISYWNSDTSQYDLTINIPGGTSQYIMDDDLKQSYMDQLTFGIERELIKDLSLGLTFIQRKNYDHIAPVDIAGIYEQVQFTEGEFTNQTFTIWNQTNSRDESKFLITNPKAGDYGIVQQTPYRKYTGVEILLNKRFSNKWQLMASYVYSKTTGNVDNSLDTGTGTVSTYTNPNEQIFSDGKLTDDPTHMLKLQGSVILPWHINMNISFSLISGNNYTRRFKLPLDIDSNTTEINLEPRGTYRYPTSKNLDVRLEKTFKVGELKFGVVFDMFNLFNEGIVTGYELLATNFQDTLTIKKPRAFRAGFRFWF